MRNIILITVLCLFIATSLTAQEEPEKKEEKKVMFMKYRKWGRDPMVSIIVKEKNTLTPGSGTTGGTPLTPGIDGDDDESGARREMQMLTRRIKDHRAEAMKAIRQRDFQRVLLHCSEGSKAVEEMEGKTKFRTLTQQQLKDYAREFKRWEFAAREGIIQKEALEDFKKRNITLQGIIWDDSEPVCILDGNAFTEKSPYMGVMIDKIGKRSVNVIFKFKEREFYYTLEFPK
jgi:hypothetical protein